MSIPPPPLPSEYQGICYNDIYNRSSVIHTRSTRIYLLHSVPSGMGPRAWHSRTINKMALADLFHRCLCFRPQPQATPPGPDLAEQATRVQAVYRGHLSRRRKVSSRGELTAAIEGTKVAPGTSNVTTYVIVVQQKTKRWEVEHRYTDWVQLDAALSRHLKQRPALLRFPQLRGASSVKQVLNKYLQQVLALSEDVPKARTLLLDFLSISHLYWQYASSMAQPGSSSQATAAPRTELAAQQLSLSSYKEHKDEDPFVRNVQDLLAVNDARGDELGACERWMPEKTAQENRAYWLRVLGT